MIRRTLKSGPLPAPSTATEELRTRIKAVELESERIQLLRLEALASNRRPKGDDPAEASLANLTHAVRLFTAGEIGGDCMQLIHAIHSALAEKSARP